MYILQIRGNRGGDHISGDLDAKHVPSNALYYCSLPSQFIRPSTVSDYIVVYIVYICTLAEKVWTERRYLSDKRRRTTTKDEKVEFYNLAATLSVKVSNSQKRFMVSSILPKNERKHSTLLL